MRSRLGLVGISLLFVASACGEPTTVGKSPTTDPSGTSPSPSSSPSPSPTATAWKTYSDDKYEFTIEYPPDFLFEAGSGNPNIEGGLRAVRFYDQNYSVGEPEGQVELHMFVKDADSLDAWLAKHSSDKDSDDPQIYYGQVSDQNSITVNGKPAIEFAWQAAEGETVHAVAFFSGERVIVLDWFANTTYEPTIKPIFERMLDSFKG